MGPNYSWAGGARPQNRVEESITGAPRVQSAGAGSTDTCMQGPRRPTHATAGAAPGSQAAGACTDRHTHVCTCALGHAQCTHLHTRAPPAVTQALSTRSQGIRSSGLLLPQPGPLGTLSIGCRKAGWMGGGSNPEEPCCMSADSRSRNKATAPLPHARQRHPAKHGVSREASQGHGLKRSAPSGGTNRGPRTRVRAWGARRGGALRAACCSPTTTDPRVPGPACPPGCVLPWPGLEGRLCP